MAVDASELRTELAGLDALETDITTKKSVVQRVWPRVWPKVAAVAIVLLGWQLVVWSGWKEQYVLPGPGAVLRTLGDLVQTGRFWEAVSRTMRRAVGTYAIALVIGSLGGALVAMVKPLRAAFGALITGLQTMPSIVWLMPAVLLFKLSETAIAFVVLMGAAPAIASAMANMSSVAAGSSAKRVTAAVVSAR